MSDYHVPTPKHRLYPADQDPPPDGPQLSRLSLLGGLTGTILLVVLGVLAWRVLSPGPGPSGDQPLPFPPAPDVESFDLIPVLRPDAIPAIIDPVLVSAEMASPELNPNERVIGLVINGDARAYPIPILSAHEIVNDVVGGEPVAVTWCPLCYTALVFSRRIEGLENELTFGVSGKLLHNTLVMYDKPSGSLWSQLYGAAVDGPMAGKSLAYFPSTHTEWQVWRTEHPNSRVLSKDQICESIGCRDYSIDRYKSYYASASEGLIDRQLPRESDLTGPKARVLGVLVEGHARAYPYDVLAKQSLINDEIGGTPVLIWFDPMSETGVAYSRLVGEQILTFEEDPGETRGLRDLETGSRWHALTGASIEGPLRKTRLEPLISTTAFEFGWEAYYPHSDTFRP